MTSATPTTAFTRASHAARPRAFSAGADPGASRDARGPSQKSCAALAPTITATAASFHASTVPYAEAQNAP